MKLHVSSRFASYIYICKGFTLTGGTTKQHLWFIGTRSTAPPQGSQTLPISCATLFHSTSRACVFEDLEISHKARTSTSRSAPTETGHGWTARWARRQRIRKGLGQANLVIGLGVGEVYHLGHWENGQNLCIYINIYNVYECIF